jgi:hypothetical protein
MYSGSMAESGRRRWQCFGGGSNRTGSYCYSTTDPQAGVRHQDGHEVRRDRPPAFRRKLRAGRQVFIITAAQNATPVHAEFWACLTQMARHRKAEILAIPIRYKNPTSRWSASQANEDHWADEVTPFLWNVRKQLNRNLVLLGEIKTQPTCSDPINGFESISGSGSAILGHTKIQLKTVSVPSNRMPKIITTTGACTVPNYTDSKAGRLGHFHHQLACLVVEIQGGRFHMRHVHYDDKTGSMTDLATRYFPNRLGPAPRPLALIQGDTHVDFIDPKVERATFGPGGLVPVLKPRHLLWHDLLDSYSISAHHQGNPFIQYGKAMAGRSNIRAEAERACRFVRARTPKGTESVVVPSNHDDMLDRWLAGHDWKTSPVNAEFYLETALAVLRGTSMGPIGVAYPPALPLIFPSMVNSMDGIRTLRPGEEFTLANWDLGTHGHRGPRGSRGSIRNLRRVGLRRVIGHSHSPGIDEGAVQTGTSTRLRADYTVGGPTDWLNAHALLHANGKAQLIFIVDGRWRG